MVEAPATDLWYVFCMTDDIRTLTDDGYIVSHPGVLGGTPCIRGTRLNIYAIAARYNGGESASEILEGYPDLSEEAVVAAVRYAADHPLVEHPDARPWRKKKVVSDQSA